MTLLGQLFGLDDIPRSLVDDYMPPPLNAPPVKRTLRDHLGDYAYERWIRTGMMVVHSNRGHTFIMTNARSGNVTFTWNAHEIVVMCAIPLDVRGDDFHLAQYLTLKLAEERFVRTALRAGWGRDVHLFQDIVDFTDKPAEIIDAFDRRYRPWTPPSNRETRRRAYNEYYPVPQPGTDLPW